MGRWSYGASATGRRRPWSLVFACFLCVVVLCFVGVRAKISEKTHSIAELLYGRVEKRRMPSYRLSSVEFIEGAGASSSMVGQFAGANILAGIWHRYAADDGEFQFQLNLRFAGRRVQHRHRG